MIKEKLIRSVVLRKLGRSDLFDEAYYREHAGISAGTDAAAHYYDGGWRTSGPSMRFRQEDYLEANPDVRAANLCPLAHYILYGRRENRRLYPEGPDCHYQANRIRRAILRRFFGLTNRTLIRRNHDARILVILHMFYEESCQEIIEYLKNLREYHYDLVVTTTEGRDVEYFRKVFLAFKKDADIRVYPNQGFDIGPYLDVINGIEPEKYDVIIKMQSKRLFSRSGAVAATMFVRGRDWFLYLFESVLGARFLHKNIDCLKNEESKELAAAENLFMNDPPHKERMTLRKLAKLNLSLPEHYVLVAGSCFAMKGSAVAKYHKGIATMESFEPSERKMFSTAHALERYLTAVIPEEARVGNRVCSRRIRKNERIGRERLRVRGLRILEETDLRLDDDFVLRYLEHAPVFHYEMMDFPVKDLYVERDEGKTIIPLRDCAPSLYLRGDKEGYIRYCLEHRKTDYMELSQEEFEKEVIRNGEARFKNLIAEMDRTGYDEKEPVVICRDGKILDGQHRACWYMNRYGEESTIRLLHLQTEPDDLYNQGRR